MGDERLAVARRLRKWAGALEESLAKFPRWSDVKTANQFHRRAAANGVSYAFRSGWVQDDYSLPVSLIADGKQGRLNWGCLRHVLNLTRIEWLAEFDGDDPPAKRRFISVAPKSLTGDDIPNGDHPADEEPAPPSRQQDCWVEIERTDEEKRRWYAMQAMAWSTILQRLADKIEPEPPKANHLKEMEPPLGETSVAILSELLALGATKNAPQTRETIARRLSWKGEGKRAFAPLKNFGYVGSCQHGYFLTDSGKVRAESLK